MINAPNNDQTITPQLMVPGSTKLGVEFYGTQTMTFDSLPYWQRRLQQLFQF